MSKVFFNIAYNNCTPPAKLSGEKRAEYIAERNFYNLTAKYNYFSYVLNGKKAVKNANAEHYFTREGTNTGLFNMDRKIDKNGLRELKKQLKYTQSPIWHGVISFDEETSLCFQTQENCIKFMRQTFGGFLKRAGFEIGNVELYCALHDDTDNRHIHFAFFEKEPLHCTASGKSGVFRQGFIGNKIIDNYLVSANMHVSDHADEYYTARDAAFAELKRIRTVHDRTGTFTSSDSSKNLLLNIEFSKLIAKLPQTGRLQYNAEEMEALRPEIDRLAMLLISSDKNAALAHKAMLQQLARIENETRALALDNKLAYLNGRRLGKDALKEITGGADLKNTEMPLRYVDMKNVDYFERIKADYRARLGNVVLNICKDIKRSSNGRRRSFVNDINLKIEAKLKRRRRTSLIQSAVKALTAVCNMESANFLKTVKEIEYEQELEKQNTVGGR